MAQIDAKRNNDELGLPWNGVRGRQLMGAAACMRGQSYPVEQPYLSALLIAW